MRRIRSALWCLGAVAWLAAGSAGADTAAGLSVELNKLESFEGGCRSFFLFRNRTDQTLTRFEMALAILDRAGIIDRLLTIEAAPLPAGRTTLKLFEIPEVTCENVGTVLLHDITACAAGEAASTDCFGMIELSSLAPAPLVK